MKAFPGLSDYPGLTLKASINSIICVGWKELDSKETHCISAWDYQKRWLKDVNDDSQVVKDAYEVLKDADVLVTHNGKRFDWKFFQTRLLVHKLPPLPKIIHIDTCSEAKKHLFPLNNRLNTLARILTSVEKKENGGWPLWVKVSEREIKAQKLMTQYCKQDVVVLEHVFNEMRPLIKGLPNANMFSDTCDLCPNCGSPKMQKRGESVNKQRRLQRYQCQDCGSWSSEGKKTLVGGA